MLDILCFGNLTIDTYYKSPNLTEHSDRFALAIGGKYYCDEFYQTLGGGALNVAAGCAKQGAKAGLVSCVGNNPFKHVVYEHLDMLSINRTHCHLVADYINFSTILLAKKGEKTVINYRSKGEDILAIKKDSNIFINVKMVYFGNLASSKMQNRIAAAKSAKNSGCKVVLTLSATDCTHHHDELFELIQLVDFLILNKHELSLLLRCDVGKINCEQTLYKTHKNHVWASVATIVTDGVNGAHAHMAENVIFEPAIKVDHIVDGTGAGDGFVAGFATSYIKDLSIAHAIKKGAQYAAAKLKHMGPH